MSAPNHTTSVTNHPDVPGLCLPASTPRILFPSGLCVGPAFFFDVAKVYLNPSVGPLPDDIMGWARAEIAKKEQAETSVADREGGPAANKSPRTESEQVAGEISA